MKRKSAKKRLRALEKEFLLLVRNYIHITETSPKDVVFKIENELELAVFKMLSLYLQLSDSWPHKERWLDYFEEFSWHKDQESLKGFTKLWYGSKSHIEASQEFEPLRVNISFSKRNAISYSFIVGEKENRYIFSVHVRTAGSSRTYGREAAIRGNKVAEIHRKDFRFCDWHWQ
jgi:hypothetical protein